MRTLPSRTTRLDVELDDGTGDNAYLAALHVALPLALDRSRPRLAIYLAGADPYRDERLGRLSLSKAGLAARARLVLAELVRRGGAVASARAGGYSRAIDDGVDIHYATVALALSRFDRRRVLDFIGDDERYRAAHP